MKNYKDTIGLIRKKIRSYLKKTSKLEALDKDSEVQFCKVVIWAMEDLLKDLGEKE